MLNIILSILFLVLTLNITNTNLFKYVQVTDSNSKFVQLLRKLYWFHFKNQIYSKADNLYPKALRYLVLSRLDTFDIKQVFITKGYRRAEQFVDIAQAQVNQIVYSYMKANNTLLYEEAIAILYRQKCEELGLPIIDQTNND